MLSFLAVQFAVTLMLLLSPCSEPRRPAGVFVLKMVLYIVIK